MRNLKTIVAGLLLTLAVLISLAECAPALGSSLRQDYFLDELTDDTDDYDGEDLIEQGYKPLELINKNQKREGQEEADDEGMIEISPSEFALNDDTYENGFDDGADDDMIVGPLKSGSVRPGN